MFNFDITFKLAKDECVFIFCAHGLYILPLMKETFDLTCMMSCINRITHKLNFAKRTAAFKLPWMYSYSTSRSVNWLGQTQAVQTQIFTNVELNGTVPDLVWNRPVILAQGWAGYWKLYYMYKIIFKNMLSKNYSHAEKHKT